MPMPISKVQFSGITYACATTTPGQCEMCVRFADYYWIIYSPMLTTPAAYDSSYCASVDTQSASYGDGLDNDGPPRHPMTGIINFKAVSGKRSNPSQWVRHTLSGKKVATVTATGLFRK